MATVASTNGQAVNSAAGAVVQNTKPAAGSVELAAKKAAEQLNGFFGSKLSKENKARVSVRQFITTLADSGLTRKEAYAVVDAGFKNIGKVIGENKLFEFVDSAVTKGRTLNSTLDNIFADAIQDVYANRVEPVVASRFTALKVIGFVVAASVLALSVYGYVAGPDAVRALVPPKVAEAVRSGANYVAEHTPAFVTNAYNATSTFVADKAAQAVVLGSSFVAGSKVKFGQVSDFVSTQGTRVVEAGKQFLETHPNAPIVAAAGVTLVGAGIVGTKLVQDFRTRQRVAEQPTTGSNLDERTRAALAQADKSLNTAGMSKEQVANLAQKKLASLEASLANLQATRKDAKKGKDVLKKEAVTKLNEAITQVEDAISSLKKVVKQNGQKAPKN